MRVCVRVRVRVCLCAPLGPSVCACVHSVCKRTVRACASRPHAPSHRTAATCGINRSARSARWRPRARGCVRCHRPGSRASAAGITWAYLSPYAVYGRQGHTSVVDAAGAIYVIGGVGISQGIGVYYNEVLARPDGGAGPGPGAVGGGGYSTGYLRGC